VGSASSAGMTESGDGARPIFFVLERGPGAISDSAEELLERGKGFEVLEEVEGQRGELAVVSWRGIEPAPSRLLIAGSSSS
jgi:hypothetical protein